MNSNEDPKDWESVPDEVPPESLQKKWDKEENSVRPPMVCPVCKSNIPPDSFHCLHCGEKVFRNSGLLGKIAAFLKFGHWGP